MGTILSTPGIDSLGTHKFSHSASDRQTIAECVSVDFRRVLRSSKFRPGGNLSQWREALHALVALYNTCLPNITPELLYSTVCSRDARSLILVMSPEMALEDLCFRYGADCVMDDVRTESTTLRTTQGSPFSTEGDSTGDALKLGMEIVDPPESPGKKTAMDKENEWQQIDYTEEEEEAAKEVCPNCRKSKYADVFSDESDSSSDENESGSDTSSEGNSSDDEEQYIAGADHFLELVKKRREWRQKNIDKRIGLSLSNVGIENRLFASVTFEKRKLENERISYLTVLSVRKRWRGLKLGQFLVQLVIRLAGNDDPLVVLADDDATEFFEKQGFTNDAMICCKYDELKKEGSWTNCTVMVRLPKLIPERRFGLSDLPVAEVEKIVDESVEKWQKAALDLYQQQVSLIRQLKTEILTGREEVAEQQRIIKILTDELDKKYEKTETSAKPNMAELTRSEIHKFDTQFEHLNLDSVMKDLSLLEDQRKPVSMRGDISNDYVVVTPLTERNAQSRKAVESGPDVTVLEDNKSELSTDDIPVTPSEHEKIQSVIKMFLSSLQQSNPSRFHQTKVINVTPINPPNYVIQPYDLHSWNQMFFCGTILSKDDILAVCEKGRFTAYNYTHGEYGIGLYFSRFAEVAMKFSKVNCIIVTGVDAGTTTSTVSSNPKRVSPGEGFDSLLTPGRLSCAITSPRSTPEEKEKYQELIVFDLKQAVPLYVLEYTVGS